MMQIGDKLPNFLGTNQNDERVHGSAYLGKKLVLYF